MDRKLHGLIPAIVMPFDENFKLQQDVLARYIELVCSAKIAALAVNTDAGEGAFLPQEEREKILSIAKKIAKNIPVVCGLGGATTYQASEFAKRYRDCGADYFLVFPHFAFRGSKGKDKAVIEYHQILSKAGVPLILFQLQEDLGGVFYTDETISELVQIDNVVAIKEATFDALKFRKMKILLDNLPKKISLLTGNDNFIMESFILGAHGALIGFGSVFTDIQADAINMALAGKYTEAIEKFSPLEKICDFCFSSPVRDYRIRMKHILVKQKIFTHAYVQPPLQQLEIKEIEVLDEILKRICV
ncbi:MAG: dihydrodipicolinate synthase family protein [bacterium]|nr:dihydrodipicolinate synthase family protein [bacterium]